VKPRSLVFSLGGSKLSFLYVVCEPGFKSCSRTPFVIERLRKKSETFASSVGVYLRIYVPCGHLPYADGRSMCRRQNYAYQIVKSEPRLRLRHVLANLAGPLFTRFPRHLLGFRKKVTNICCRIGSTGRFQIRNDNICEHAIGTKRGGIRSRCPGYFTIQTLFATPIVCLSKTNVKYIYTGILNDSPFITTRREGPAPRIKH
jgi:hypothetical protein